MGEGIVKGVICGLVDTPVYSLSKICMFTSLDRCIDIIFSLKKVDYKTSCIIGSHFNKSGYISMYIHFKKSGNTGTKMLTISSNIMWFLFFYIFILNFMHVWKFAFIL